MSAAGNDSGARGSGIGARLQAAREAAGMSLVEAAEHLHVDPSVLSALEGERFGELGAPVYARGHLRHYAELLKLPATELDEGESERSGTKGSGVVESSPLEIEG